MTRFDPAKDAWIKHWPKLSRARNLLVGAAVFHIVVTLSVYGLGRYGALPGTFDTNGIAVSFAPDGIELQQEATQLSDALARGQIRDWLFAVSPFHIKLYSICFALLGSWLGPNILSAEPLNVLCYLGILVLIFKLGQEIFNRRAGLIAAATVALWPTFLLHTTQLLKDPLFLVGMLAFILVNLRLLSRSFSWPGALFTGAIGGSIALFLWLLRASMGEILIATFALAAVMLVVRQLREKHLQAANLVGLALLIVLSVGVTQVVPKFRTRIRVEKSPRAPANPWWPIAARVGKARQMFINEYPDATSNLDSNVQLSTTADVIRYLPRAAAIGFFAPFPNMWLVTGDRVGSAGRLLSGVETLAMYLVEGLAIVGLWTGRRGRRRFSVWFVWLVAAMGMISLGLVVTNVGTLYRLRYVFLILLIILATEGAVRTFDWFRKKNSNRSQGAAQV